MLNSERTFSRKSLYEDLEDSFFRNIMAIYCENESEKLLEEMKSSCEKPENAVSISKIYRRVHRSASLTSAFRVLRKITDRVALLVLAAVIIFAGAVTASAEVRSSLAEFTSRWSNFKDISGKAFDLGGDDIKNFTVNYVVGWNFDSNGYKKIIDKSKVLGGTVYAPASSYYVSYDLNSDKYSRVICNDNSYTISYEKNSAPIKGILTADENGNAVFYPYYRDTLDNFFIVCERSKDWENYFEKNTHIALPDGTKAHVQPFGIQLLIRSLDEDGHDLSYFPDFNSICSENSDYLEVEIKFDFIGVSPYSMAEDDEISDTSAYAPIDDLSLIKVVKLY